MKQTVLASETYGFIPNWLPQVGPVPTGKWLMAVPSMIELDPIVLPHWLSSSMAVHNYGHL